MSSEPNVLLETMVGTRFEPDPNARGDVVRANWTFFLPRLDVKRVLCAGIPFRAALSTLIRLAVLQNALRVERVDWYTTW